jgi:[acyl-carrier-protein] S-malonyltransferase
VIGDELAAQLTGGVRWTASMQRALEDGVTDFVELGPGEALVGMIKRIDRAANRHSVGDPAGVAAFVEWWQSR